MNLFTADPIFTIVFFSVLFIFILLISIIFLIFVNYLSYWLQVERVNQLKRAEEVTQTSKNLTDANQTAKLIIEDANKKAAEIIKQAQIDADKISQEYKKTLEEHLKMQEKAIVYASSTLSNQYTKSLETETAQSIQNLEKTSDIFEEKVLTEVDKISDKLEKEILESEDLLRTKMNEKYDNLESEMSRIRNERIQKIDTEIYDILLRFLKNFTQEVYPVEKHHSLVLKLLEEAKENVKFKNA